MKRYNPGKLMFLIIIIGILAIIVPYMTLYVSAEEAPGTEWNKIFGGTKSDQFFSVGVSSDGYILTGKTNTLGWGWIEKLDDSGMEDWRWTYGDSIYDYFNSVDVDANGDYIVAGVADSDGFVVKLDENGNEQWSRMFGGDSNDQFNYVRVDSDGGYILAGHTYSSGAGNSDGWVVKLDASGVEQWSKTFGGNDDDVFESVGVVSDGYILAGRTDSSGAGSNDGWVVKIDASGSEVWSRTFGGTLDDVFWSVGIISDGCILAGNTRSQGIYYGGAWVVKLDEGGNEQWSETYGERSSDTFYSVAISSDDVYIIAGSKDGDGWLVKLDASGNEQWGKTFGGAEPDLFYSVDIIPGSPSTRESYVMTGYTDSQGSGDYDGWVVKTEPGIPGVIIPGSPVTTTPTMTNTVTTATTCPDSDGDGWDDCYEDAAGTNPYFIDTDNDGLIDSEDPNPLLPQTTDITITTTQTTQSPGYGFILSIVGIIIISFYILQVRK